MPHAQQRVSWHLPLCISPTPRAIIELPYLLVLLKLFTKQNKKSASDFTPDADWQYNNYLLSDVVIVFISLFFCFTALFLTLLIF